ncbi:MAG TPA: hypothetical protein VIW47_13375 [Nitrospiraceae bacterium]|jgi:hypothetical protein
MKTLASDKAACDQEAKRQRFGTAGNLWQTEVNSCMEKKGWGQKAID